jgi:tetratricopeptide (TPR) repeat protein
MSNRIPDDYKQLIELAQSYLDGGDQERGLALLKQASEVAGAAGEPIQQSAILNNLGLEQERAGQGEIARDTLLRSLNLLRHANALNEANILNNLGLIERNLGNLDAAKQYYQSALELVTKVNERVEIAWALSNLGIVSKDQSQLTQARAYFDRALTLLEDQDASHARAHALTGLGLTLELLCDAAGAQAKFLEAMEIYRQVDDSENEALILHNLAQLHDNQGNWFNALEYYFQSLAINLSCNYKLGVAENISALAALISNIHQVLENLNQQHDNPLRDNPLKFPDIMATWLQLFKESLTNDIRSGDTADLVLVEALTESDSLDQALQMYEQILSLHQAMGYRSGQMQALIDLALLSRNAEQLDAAEQYLNQALVLAQEIGNPDNLYNIYFNRGDVRMMAGRISQAIEDYAAAVDAAESIRVSLLLEEEALGYFNESNLYAFERLVRLEAPFHPTPALIWAERAKSREFLRRLRLSEVTRSHRIPQELIDKEMQLLTQLRQAAALLQAADEPDRLSALRKYEAAEQALRLLWDEMEPMVPEYVALRQGKPASWEELQRCLQP